MMIERLICLPKFRINKIEYRNTSITIFASIKSRRSQCPACGSFSASVHDSYTRKIADLSVFQISTTILPKTRKLKCKDSTCHRKVFSEQTPHVLPYSRRTTRAASLLETLSTELTGKPGSLLSKQLLIPVSCSTVTRTALKQKLPEIVQPTILGVGDWAFRKGINYGTILIDMETSRPIDLLASRESNDLKEWLKKYPDLKILTRDRASSYSSAINEDCPDAIQIADRYHLLMNLSDALDQYFKSVGPEIRLLIKNKTEEVKQTYASGKPPDEKENIDSESILYVPEIEPIYTDKRTDTFNKVKKL